MVGQAKTYVRVSSAEQNVEHQLEAVSNRDRAFQGKVSGICRAKCTGPGDLMTHVREGVWRSSSPWSASAGTPSPPGRTSETNTALTRPAGTSRRSRGRPTAPMNSST